MAAGNKIAKVIFFLASLLQVSRVCTPQLYRSVTTTQQSVLVQICDVARCHSVLIVYLAK